MGEERSFFSYKLVINGVNIYLPKINERVYEIEAVSKANILFIIGVIKRLLNNSITSSL